MTEEEGGSGGESLAVRIFYRTHEARARRAEESAGG